MVILGVQMLRLAESIQGLLDCRLAKRCLPRYRSGPCRDWVKNRESQ